MTRVSLDSFYFRFDETPGLGDEVVLVVRGTVNRLASDMVDVTSIGKLSEYLPGLTEVSLHVTNVSPVKEQATV